MRTLSENSLAALALLLLAAGPAIAGHAVLSWQAPEENTDGSPLEDLAGFRVAWDCTTDDPADFSDSVDLLQPNLRSLYLTGLPDEGTCWFAAYALNAGRTPSGNAPLSTSDSSGPSNVASKNMSDGTAAPAEPYTRRVPFDAAPGDDPLEVLPPVRLAIGYTGEPIIFARDATSGPTSTEFEFEDVQAGQVTAETTTDEALAWIPPRAGLWYVRQRSCNSDGCGAWRGALEDGFAFLIRLSAPTDGGFE